MTRTRIEWCDYTWNPVIGCRGACPYCYARRMARRFHLGRSDFLPEWNEHNFNMPFPRKPSRIFVNSMSDLADWEEGWTARVLDRIHMHPEHRFLFLSKRPWKVPQWIDWTNVMLGYSVTQQADLDSLLVNGGRGNVSFLSIEPLLDRVEGPTLWTPKWIIVGAETGNRKGRVVPDEMWLAEIYRFAGQNHVPLFFKESLRKTWTWKYFPQEFPVMVRESKEGEKHA